MNFQLSENTKKILYFVGLASIFLATVHVPFDGKITLSVPLLFLIVIAGLTIKI